jgi:hypothetical protein
MLNHPHKMQLVGADRHNLALASALLDQAGWSTQVLEEPAQCLHAKACRWLQLPSSACLREALDDAIAVLEDSRNAFRSRDLAALRWRLLHLREQLYPA